MNNNKSLSNLYEKINNEIYLVGGSYALKTYLLEKCNTFVKWQANDIDLFTFMKNTPKVITLNDINEEYKKWGNYISDNNYNVKLNVNFDWKKYTNIDVQNIPNYIAIEDKPQNNQEDGTKYHDKAIIAVGTYNLYNTKIQIILIEPRVYANTILFGCQSNEYNIHDLFKILSKITDIRFYYKNSTEKRIWHVSEYDNHFLQSNTLLGPFCKNRKKKYIDRGFNIYIKNI